jgi:transcriptional regulator with XRE-family HTH domain/KaiC/GvpD/RAD55 family RecA-like ATPase
LLRFAADLRRLRQESGNPTYRQLAERVHYSVATLSTAANGQKLPSLAVTMAYVRACAGDQDKWERRWHELAAELATEDGAAEAATNGADRAPNGAAAVAAPRAPYVGLAAFQCADADWFFGRERLVDELVARLARRRFVAVFGASGAGKSSLLRAGLLPRLRARTDAETAEKDTETAEKNAQQTTAATQAETLAATKAEAQAATNGQREDGRRHRRILVFTPGARPLEECAIQLAALTGGTPGPVHAELVADRRGLHRMVRQALADRPDASELVLVVDQFEEVFTLCRDRAERARFIDALITAALTDGSRCRVVLGVRADFYLHCTEHAELVEALTDAQIAVGPMTTDELRRAIVQPAARVECAVEGALLADLIAHANGRVGVLPLLSHALLETWRRRRGNTLTLAGFQAAGGIEGALARSAEAVYTSLRPAQQRLAKDLFVRLTALGEGTEDTKRRISRAELDADDPDTAVVIDRLAGERLLTVDRDSIEITHEALIRRWPRLRDWLTEDREGIRVHRQLTEAARAWESLDRDPGALYRGTRLERAEELFGTRLENDDLTPRERTFLTASLAARAAERDTETRTARRGPTPIDLTGLEYDILVALARRPGRVVPREALMAEVWDENWFGSTKTLDTHIGWLRRKLGDTRSAPRFIQTVRGVGFRFAASEEIDP